MTLRKTSSIAIALFLALTIAATMTNLPLTNAIDIPTYAFITVSPNPVGVGQTVSVIMWLDKVPPTAFGPLGDRWKNFEVSITKPDGKAETLGPLTSDPAGSAYATYTPTQIGTYTFQLKFPGQNITAVNQYFKPSDSMNVTLIVQEEQIQGWPDSALPTEYWTRPISGEYRTWYSIAGNWLGTGFKQAFHSSQYNSSGNFAPYTTAPNAPHIMWTKPVAFGGLIGGEYGDTGTSSYYTGHSYEPKFTPPIIINGILYYNTPDPPDYGFSAVDLRTGETLWWRNTTGEPPPKELGFSQFAGVNYPQLTMGQIYNYISPNQFGGIPYLWSTNTNNWHMYDAFTGNWILSFANATPQLQSIVMGKSGELLAYVLDGTKNWLAMWNSSKAIGPASKYASSVFANTTGQWQWRPPPGYILNWLDGIQWNVTTPAYPGQSIFKISSEVIIAATQRAPGMPSATYDRQIDIGYDANTGRLLWIENRSFPSYPTTFGRMGAMINGIYTEYDSSLMQWHGYDALTGKKLWGPTKQYENPWAMYAVGTYSADAAYGMMFANLIDGIHAHNLTTGERLWDFHAESSGFETVYGNFEFDLGPMTIADGKIFAATGHSHVQPLHRGAKLYAINATNGKEIWSIAGWMIGGWSGSIAVADGYIVTLNGYDNQIYCFGKGPSATTVTASPKVSVHGNKVLVEGTVIDIAAGTKQDAQAARFPNGVPAVADESMSEWMEYVYMQKPKPADTTGVKVTITVLDPNNNCYDVATATSDANGFYSATFEPPVPGKYTIYATFEGSESYWPSQAQTAIVVEDAPQPTPEPTPTQAPMTDTYITGFGIAIIVAIAIVGFLILRKR